MRERKESFSQIAETGWSPGSFSTVGAGHCTRLTRQVAPLSWSTKAMICILPFSKWECSLWTMLLVREKARQTISAYLDTKVSFQLLQWGSVHTFSLNYEKDTSVSIRYHNSEEARQSAQFSSVAQSSLPPHEQQHARPPCPSPTPGVYPNSRPLSRWCHPTISSSVVPFSSCPQSLPASGSFPISQLFTSGGQRTGVSASTSVLPMNTQDWSPLGWTGWISLQSKRLWRVFSNTTVQKHQFFSAQLSL